MGKVIAWLRAKFGLGDVRLLVLRERDVLAVRYPGPLPDDAVARIVTEFKEVLGEGVKVVVLPDGMTLSVVRPSACPDRIPKGGVAYNPMHATPAPWAERQDIKPPKREGTAASCAHPEWIDCTTWVDAAERKHRAICRRCGAYRVTKEDE